MPSLRIFEKKIALHIVDNDSGGSLSVFYNLWKEKKLQNFSFAIHRLAMFFFQLEEMHTNIQTYWTLKCGLMLVSNLLHSLLYFSNPCIIYITSLCHTFSFYILITLILHQIHSTQKSHYKFILILVGSFSHLNLFQTISKKKKGKVGKVLFCFKYIYWKKKTLEGKYTFLKYHAI